jgi:hypothetical protein
MGTRRLDVLEILDRWAGTDHRYFKVVASDADIYVLRHDERADEWSLAAYRRP